MNKDTTVLICDPAHPWANSIGILGEPLDTMPGMYVVTLDNGINTGCYISQLEDLEANPTKGLES